MPIKIVDEDRNELQMAYHFEATDLVSSLEKCTLSEFKKSFTKWDTSFAEKGWISIYLSNHDQSRFVNRFGSDDPKFKDNSDKNVKHIYSFHERNALCLLW